MEETLVGSKRRWLARYQGLKNRETQLLYVACWCFIMAQYVVNDHPWNSGFRIVALLALIAAMFIGSRTRKV